MKQNTEFHNALTSRFLQTYALFSPSGSPFRPWAPVCLDSLWGEGLSNDEARKERDSCLHFTSISPAKACINCFKMISSSGWNMLNLLSAETHKNYHFHSASKNHLNNSAFVKLITWMQRQDLGYNPGKFLLVRSVLILSRPRALLGGGCLEICAEKESDAVLGINSFLKPPVWTTKSFHALGIFLLLFISQVGGLCLSCIQKLEGFLQKLAWVSSQIWEGPNEDSREVQIAASFTLPDWSFICVGGVRMGTTAGTTGCGTSPQRPAVSFLCLLWQREVSWESAQGC